MPSAIPTEHTALALDQAVATERQAWTDWLAATGYGSDWTSDFTVPCTDLELAKAYVRTATPLDAGITVEEWADCLDLAAPTVPQDQQAPTPDLIAVLRATLIDPVSAVLFDNGAMHTLRNGHGWTVTGPLDPQTIAIWTDAVLGGQAASQVLTGSVPELTASIDIREGGAPRSVSLTFRQGRKGLSLVVRPIHHP